MRSRDVAAEVEDADARERARGIVGHVALWVTVGSVMPYGKVGRPLMTARVFDRTPEPSSLLHAK
jgi:hypothetical protein